MRSMTRQRLFVATASVLTALMTPIVVLASNDEDATPLDARLLGYKEGNAALKDASGTAVTWLLCIVLTAVCVGVMFINSKRSHLD